MDTPEASFQAWVMVGNALNLLLNGVPADAFADPAARENLERLDEELKSIPPDEMLARLHALSADDKHLLTLACRRAMHLAGSQQETLLGVTTEEAHSILHLLSRESRSH